MTLIQFFRLVARHVNIMLLTAVVAAGTVFFLTRHSKKEYQSYAIINTGLVSGYNIESSQSESRVDYAYTNNEIENIITLVRSRETLEELNARLLAQAILLNHPEAGVISPEAWAALQETLPAAARAEVVVPDNFEKTLVNIKSCRDRNGENPVKKILQGPHELFGIEHLQTLVVKREGSSDQIRIAYTTSDAAVCRNTIAQLIELFTTKHRDLQEGQTASVLDFFAQSTGESAAALTGKEDDLLSFMVGNKIINYYEQTRFIAGKKEDLDEFYYKELMKLAAADSSRRQLERQLNSRVNLPAINQNMIAQREQLSTISTRLVSLEISSLTDSLSDPGAARDLSALRKQAEQTKNALRQSANAVFAVNRTPEGLETQNLLSHWLEQSLDVEQTVARLSVLRDRKIEFEHIYSRFAPWGSKLKRLEREIDVAEKAYLENLHSYNQARLHKYNMLMSTNLRVVDAPFLPEKPQSSKRAMLVIVAFLAGFFLVLAGVIAVELLDSSLREPLRAAETIGITLASAFPKLPAQWASDQNLNYAVILQRASEQALQRIHLDLRQAGITHRPAKILVLSTKTGEGKSLVIEYLRAKAPAFQADYEFIEIPALLSAAFPVEVLQNADAAMLVAHANSTWQAADVRALNLVTEVMARPCRLVLNAVRPDELENALGEMPRKRSVLRRFIKRLTR